MALKFLSLSAVCAFLLCSFEPAGFISKALAASSPKAAVNDLNKGILESDNQYQNLFDEIKRNFDLNRVALTSIGIRRWKQWDKNQRKTYRKIFTEYVVALYFDRFSQSQGDGLNIYAVEQKGKRARVRTTIKQKIDEKTLASQKPINIDFLLFAQNKNGRKDWLIVDVYFKGTISEAASFRAQFKKILDDKGFDGLIKELKQKKAQFDQKR